MAVEENNISDVRYNNLDYNRDFHWCGNICVPKDGEIYSSIDLHVFICKQACITSSTQDDY